MTAKALMFQGTGSDVGKSLVVAGLCRVLTRRGFDVAPFKPQNMSNNAAVTADGGEIGRAQALQARACGKQAMIDMNPVLLKPQSETGSQVVVQGEVLGNFAAKDYRTLKPQLMPRVMQSYRRLAETSDIVLVEGAGSASEVNLRDSDIANMGFALEADVPVVLIGDIDRGGVIASLVGTYALLTHQEKLLVKGYIINKFRGDQSLFCSGIDIIAKATNFQCFGVLPYLQAAKDLPAEDSLALQGGIRERPGAAIRIVVPHVLHISNFDDFDPLSSEPDVDFQFIPEGKPLPGDADLVILPGTKTTLAALVHFKAQGWDIDLAAHVRRGGRVLGICGGYQMLGQKVFDPIGIEGPSGEVEGLKLLDIATTISSEKMLVETKGEAVNGFGPVTGYEIHMGQTHGADCERPFLFLTGGPGGAVSLNGQIMGCYLHGLFGSDEFRHAFLNGLKKRDGGIGNYDAHVDGALNKIADQMEVSLDIDRLLALAQ